MQKSRLKVIGATAAVAVVAGGGVGAWWITNDSSNPTVVSAAEGAEARAELGLRLPGGGGESALAATPAGTKLAADSMSIDCGVPYVPTAEELAAANADTDALAAVLDRFGATYSVVTTDDGFTYIESDYQDMVVSSIISSYWESRYPPVPPTQAEFDDVKKQNDGIAKALDAVGVTYTRSTDEAGWDLMEWDYENPAAQEAIDAYYAELYPPQPPTAEELATIQADNDEMAAAFDAAGITYTRISDELGWEWIEWDYNDEATTVKVNEVFAELYPVDPNDCGMLYDDAIAPRSEDAAGKAPALESVEPAVIEDEVVDGEVVDGDAMISIAPEEEMSPELIAQRDAEAAAMQSGLEAAGVTVRTDGESPWQIVIFDVNNDAAVDVIKAVLATRG